MLFRSAKLFRAYDKDYSGTLDCDEFLVILHVLDPTLEMEDVTDSFAMVGAGESMDRELFWSWCNNLLGDFDDTQFRERIQELISVSNSVAKPFVLTAENLKLASLSESSAGDVSERTDRSQIVAEDSETERRAWYRLHFPLCSID